MDSGRLIPFHQLTLPGTQALTLGPVASGVETEPDLSHEPSEALGSSSFANNGPPPMNWLPFDDSVDAGLPDHRSPLEYPTTLSGTPGIQSSALVGLNDPQWWSTLAGPMIPLIAAMGGFSASLGSDSVPIALSSLETDYGDVEARYSNGSGARYSCSQSYSARRRTTQRSEKPALPPSPIDESARINPEFRWLECFERTLAEDTQSLQQGRFSTPNNVYADILTKMDARVQFKAVGTTDVLHSRKMLAKETLNRLIQLYFKHFHPVYPFLDQPLLSMPIWGWSLCLATASIGSCYANIPGAERVGDALALLLRETLVKEVRMSIRWVISADLLTRAAARSRPYRQGITLSTSAHP